MGPCIQEFYLRGILGMYKKTGTKDRTDRKPGHIYTHDNTHLAKLLMDTQVVHHYDPIDDLQQGLLCDWLIRLFQRSSQQQAIVAMASFNFRKSSEKEVGKSTDSIRDGITK